MSVPFLSCPLGYFETAKVTFRFTGNERLRESIEAVSANACYSKTSDEKLIGNEMRKGFAGAIDKLPHLGKSLFVVAGGGQQKIAGGDGNNDFAF